MEKKINIAELLKDCPKGMELYSPLCGECRVIKIYDSLGFDVVNGNDDVFTFSYDGRYNLMGECCIFPSKDNRDWSTFQRPFKDGDIVTWEDRGSLVACIYKERKNIATFSHHIALYNGNLGIVVNGEIVLTDDELCFATEEEKQKLFDAIKENGYKWNAETKTLEKLPKFKVGDRVCNKNYKDYIYDIYDITDKGYRAKEINADSPIIILFGSQEDNYELVPNKFDITTLKPFDKVLVRQNVYGKWGIDFFGFYKEGYYHTTGSCIYVQCIPYKCNEHLCGTTNDCVEFYKTW